jgi:probable rRNA maturation factor
MNKIEIFSTRATYKKYESKLLKTARQSLKVLGKDKIYLKIYLIQSSESRSINKQFRKKDRATNVLSFESLPQGVFVDPEVTKRRVRFFDIGEIYLCPEYIEKKGEEMQSLFIHGLLHLFHYDHKGKNDTIRMNKLEKKLCGKILLLDSMLERRRLK